MLGKGSYRGVMLGQLTTDPTRTRAGAAVGSSGWRRTGSQSMVEKVSKRAGEVVTFLVEGLRDKVYRNVDVIMINHSRRLLGVSSDMVRPAERWPSPPSPGGASGPPPEEEMWLQYREYCRRLEQLGKVGGGMELTSKEIISKLLNPEEGLCKDIE